MGGKGETASALYPLPYSRIEVSGNEDCVTQWNAHRICYETGAANIAMKGPQLEDMPDVLHLAESQGGSFLI